MKDRLTQFLQFEQLSPARFADILGVQRSGISHLLSGRNKPGFDLIEKMLVKFPDLSAEWLITGKGSICKERNVPTLLPENVNVISPPIGTAPPQAERLEASLDVAPEKQHITSEKQALLPLDLSGGKPHDRAISKIVILYTDRSFGEYHPE